MSAECRLCGRDLDGDFSCAACECVKRLSLAEQEVKCLRSVLSEWDFDKSCYVQMIRANDFNRKRVALDSKKESGK